MTRLSKKILGVSRVSKAPKVPTGKTARQQRWRRRRRAGRRCFRIECDEILRRGIVDSAAPGGGTIILRSRCGLSDAELALVKHKVEQHIPPEIAEARAVTLKALKEAEQGWQRAIDKIGERAGLIKRPDGMNNG